MKQEARSTVVSWLASALLGAATLEFLTLRIVLRSGPMLERGRASVVIADALLFVGLTAMTAGVLLAAGLIVILSWRNLSANAWSLMVAGGAGLTLVGVLLLAVSPLHPRVSLLFPAMLLSGIVAAAVMTIPARTTSARAFLLLICGALFSISLYYAAQVKEVVSSWPAGISALHAGELLILASGVAALFLPRRPLSRGAVIAGILASGFLLAWLVALPWLPRTVAIWNFGLSMFVPAPVYAVVLGVFTMAVVQLLRQDAQLASAILLIALGGLKWDVPYFHLLGIAGLLLLVDTLQTIEPRAMALQLVPAHSGSSLGGWGRHEAETGKPGNGQPTVPA